MDTPLDLSEMQPDSLSEANTASTEVMWLKTPFARFWGLILGLALILGIIAERATEPILNRLVDYLTPQVTNPRAIPVKNAKPALRERLLNAVVFVQLLAIVMLFEFLSRILYRSLVGEDLSAGNSTWDKFLLITYYVSASALHYGTILHIFFNTWGLLGRVVSFGIYATTNALYYVFSGPLTQYCHALTEGLLVTAATLFRPTIFVQFLAFALVTTVAPLAVSGLAMRGRDTKRAGLGLTRQLFLVVGNVFLVVLSMQWNAHLSAQIVTTAQPWGWCGVEECAPGNTCPGKRRNKLHSTIPFLGHSALFFLIFYVIIDRYIKVATLWQRVGYFFRHGPLFSLDRDGPTIRYWDRLFRVALPPPIERLAQSMARIAASPLWPDLMAMFEQMYRQPNQPQARRELDTALLEYVLKILGLIEQANIAVSACLEATRARFISIPMRLVLGFSMDTNAGFDLSGIKFGIYRYTGRSVFHDFFGGIPLPKFMWRKEPIFTASLFQEEEWIAREEKDGPASVDHALPFLVNVRFYTAALCRLLARVESKLKLPPSCRLSGYWRRMLMKGPIRSEHAPMRQPQDFPQMPEGADARIAWLLRAAARANQAPLRELPENEVDNWDESRDPFHNEDDAVVPPGPANVEEEAAPVNLAAGAWYLAPALRAILNALLTGQDDADGLGGMAGWRRPFVQCAQGVHAAAVGDFQVALQHFRGSVEIVVDGIMAMCNFDSFDTVAPVDTSVSSWPWIHALCPCWRHRGATRNTPSVVNLVKSALRRSKITRNAFGVHRQPYMEFSVTIRQDDLEMEIPLIIMDGDAYGGILMDEHIIEGVVLKITKAIQEIREMSTGGLVELAAAAATRPAPLERQLSGSFTPNLLPRNIITEFQGEARAALVRLSRSTRITRKHALMLGIVAPVEGQVAAPVRSRRDLISSALLRQYGPVLQAAVHLFALENRIDEGGPEVQLPATAVSAEAVAILDTHALARLQNAFVNSRRMYLSSHRWISVHRASLAFTAAVLLHFAESYARASTLASALTEARPGPAPQSMPALERVSAADAQPQNPDLGNELTEDFLVEQDVRPVQLVVRTVGSIVAVAVNRLAS